MTGNHNGAAILKDVVAFVDVWSSSKNENYSKTFALQLMDMGAVVTKTFNKQVTHVVFKDGHQKTWQKAKKTGVKLVSVLWVESCKESGQRADESLYPAVWDEFNKRTHRCMQPTDKKVRTPQNDKRMQRKLDRMIKDLNLPKSPIATSFPSVIFDEEGTLVYNPTLVKRADSMAKRLDEMKQKRENLSPTASQMIESGSSQSSHRPSIGNSPSGSFFQNLEEESADLNSSFGDLFGGSLKKNEKELPKETPTSNAGIESNDESQERNITCSPPIKKPKRHSARVKSQPKSTAFSNKDTCDGKPSEEDKRQKSIEESNRRVSLNMEENDNGSKLNSVVNCSTAVDVCTNKLTCKKETTDNNISVVSPREYSTFVKTSGKQKKGSINSVMKTPSKSLGCSPSKDELEYEDYFYSANVRKHDPCIRRSSLGNLSSRSISFPQFVLEQPPGKRKRSDEENTTGCGSKSSAGDQSVNSFEMYKNQTHRCNEKKLKMEQKIKVTRTLVMTSMPSDKQNVVIQVVNKLGGFSFTDTVCESTTHVVTGHPRRTLNVLLGIARGCWILSFEWILWCLERGQWIPEEPYELSDQFPAAPICRLQQHLSAGEHQQDLFARQPVMFISPLSQPPCGRLAELILLCGGKVCRTVRQAGICIGHHKGKTAPGTHCLSEQWVLDCITHLKQFPYENYLLE
nr:PREDICTED: microcephalin isoform X1 [Lepisosteus oculatus]XP_015218720.1 PREDICTED: microcephalin isoform X1 [Lepisosteus oculatus]XP_015218721.1 PREDICTED: microcephalin isoform X1 [Lepisosteus oculatus]XP_015218722.1 PREDICTED: microcephalin isoform X1 [Lepisosteus oculatus]